jgi:hypothetical protein
MCIIIDANMAHKFADPPHEEVEPVVKWLLTKRRVRHVLVGGKLGSELSTAGEKFRAFLTTLKRAGRVFEVDDELVKKEKAKVEKVAERLGYKDVDDCHIIALARMGGSRLLASYDVRTKLHQMFKDRRLLDPPGKVYQSASHKRLLNGSPRCYGAHDRV